MSEPMANDHEASTGPSLRHLSVLPVEVMTLLDPRPGEVWVDATVGVGGHSRLIAERVRPTGRVIGFDQDPAMLALARQRLAGLPFEAVHGNFESIRELLAELGLARVDGVLADLGICSDQLDEADRGLSFQREGPLDMRLDPRLGASAADLLARLSERELADIFYRYGEERHSRRVARRICEQRRTQPLRTTTELAELLRRTVPRGGGIDPATRVFQALRIAVNDELGTLERFLAALPRVLNPGGRVGVMSFHSLEDRLVKQALRNPAVWRLLTRKPVQASDHEVRANPRSRSAKLRTAERLAEPTTDTGTKGG